MNLRLIALAGALATFACGGDKDAPRDGALPATSTAAAQAEDDLQDVTKFKLTMDRVDKYLAAQKNVMIRFKNMTPAEREAASMSNDNNATLDQMVAKVEGNAAMKQEVKKAGLSPREYVLVTVSYMQTAMASAVMKMQPKANQDSLARAMKANPDNIRFFQEHEAEITKKFQDAAVELKKLGIEDDA